MKVNSYTNKGSREKNQDYIVYASFPDSSGLYIIADGMGGYTEGAIASKVVADAILEYIERNYNKQPAGVLLKEAIPFANDALMLKRVAMAGGKMGCVVAVLLISKGYAHLTWLGDSRIYLFRKGKEVYRTEDHSVLNKFSKIKYMSAANVEKYASIVTKSIMGEDNVDRAPIVKIEVQPKDIFVLCTDGFHKELNLDIALNFDESKRNRLKSIAKEILDNFSFIKVEI